MKISKTAFKEYTRCQKVYPLDEVYRKKTNSKVSVFDNDRYEKIIELLGSMFDIDSGDDLLEQKNAQLEAMMQYYNDVEKYAIEIANVKYGIDCKYYSNVLDQKSFSFVDVGFNELYCYLDGYHEGNDEVYIIEVKATTSKKFRELGPKRKKVINNNKHNSIFETIDNELVLKKKFDDELTPEIYQSYYLKLFDRYSDVGKYVFDIAVERYIIENSINNYNSSLKNKKIRYLLAVLNSDYVFDGKYINGLPVYDYDKNNQLLINFIDMTDITNDYLTIIEKEHKNLLQSILENDVNNIAVGKYCDYNKQTKCHFTSVCWKDAMGAGSILEYLGLKKFKDDFGKSIDAIHLINQGKHRINSIPKSYLTNNNHIIQRECFEDNKEYLNLKKIKDGLDKLVYPIYHLDFESFPCPLPRYKGENPYNQSVFQFSIHVEKEKKVCNKDHDNFSFLPTNFDDQRENLVKEMIKIINLDQGGTVLVYNKNFEKTRIKELMKIFPQYKKELEKINSHMFDLLDIVKTSQSFYKGLGYNEEESKMINFYNNKLYGSYSIKKVLPIFSDLSYNDLNVGNGTEAIAAYATFPYLTEEDLKKTRKDLIEYCKQDTWAMVVVLWGLIEKIGDYNE